ncbi:restriction endonuclease subunit S [Flavisolibacter nicotianae]|uniref:restriction endonuclease subunit S n=1 Tax=Flavisolibacter nicotianae TaxID=2364882 RepID=UPI000EB25928|nr:restriction endonuclease subunit S [Flavisolibacter nicotianae]
MNRVDELIEQFCPDGVEFKPIGEVVLKTKNIRWSENTGEEFKYIDLTSVDRTTHSIVDITSINSETAPSRAQQIVQEGDVIFGTTRPMLKRYAIIPLQYDRQICSTGYCVLRPDNNIVLTNFLFHLLGTPSFYEYVEANEQGTSYPAISDSVLRKFQIPVPPLEIQNEIVSILDKFKLLEAELEAELEARKTQYEHYRNALLSCEAKNVEWKTLGEIAKIQRGTAITKKETISGEFPVVANGPTPIYYHNEFNRNGEIIVVARSGAYCGLVSYWNEPLFLTDAFSIHPENTLLKTKFVYYFLKKDQDKIHSTKKGSGVPHVRATDFESYLIPILPLSEQEKIVSILDKFDALVNDISIGLPAEIEARRRQYEYYRNKLLTFKNVSNG